LTSLLLVRLEWKAHWIRGETIELGAVQYLDVPDDYAGRYKVKSIEETHLKGSQVRLTYDMRRSRIQPN
jgi:hypothetical protein